MRWIEKGLIKNASLGKAGSKAAFATLLPTLPCSPFWGPHGGHVHKHAGSVRPGKRKKTNAWCDLKRVLVWITCAVEITSCKDNCTILALMGMGTHANPPGQARIPTNCATETAWDTVRHESTSTNYLTRYLFKAFLAA